MTKVLPNPKRIAHDCAEAAEYYRNKPGHTGAETMIDLYAVIAQLAEVVSDHQDRLARLMPDKLHDV